MAHLLLRSKRTHNVVGEGEKGKVDENKLVVIKTVGAGGAPTSRRGAIKSSAPPAIAASFKVPESFVNIKKAVSKKISTDDVPVFNISFVKSMFMSAELIKKLSVVEIKRMGYEGYLTINSPEMGSLSYTTPCATCGRFSIDCPGHLGRISLPVPLPNPLAIDLIVYVLQSVCGNCGRLLLSNHLRNSPSLLRLKGIARLKEIAKLVLQISSDTINCPRNNNLAEGETRCPSGAIEYFAPKGVDVYQIKAIHKIVKSGKQSSKRETVEIPIPIENIVSIFERIPADDLEAFGFSNDIHPLNFIITELPVIPERNRPTTERNGEKSPDHITVFYNEYILRPKLDLERLLIARDETNPKPSLESDISIKTSELYTGISQMFDNYDGRKKIGMKDVASTIKHRMAGKYGLCRNTAHGKRADRTGRSVIGPAITPFGSIIIPSMMRSITIPEIVTVYNRDALQAKAVNGEVIHIIRKNGRLAGIRMNYPKLVTDAILTKCEMEPLEVGDKIYRIGSNGDEVIFNRQPTLHRHSMIGARVKFGASKTIKIPMPYTTPANADFDGDEAALNFMQTNEARAEIRHILGARNQIISSANSMPAYGLVFNCPLAAYLISIDHDNKKEILNANEWENFIDTFLVDSSRASTLNDRLKKHSIGKRTCRALFSLALPEDFFYTRTYGDKFTDKKITVVIKDGVFVSGILVKGDVASSIIQQLFTRYGSEVTSRFISEAHFILDWYLERRGFSLGISDVYTSNDEVSKKVNQAISTINTDVKLITEYNDGTKIVPATDEQRMHMEIEINSTLDSIVNIGAKIVKEGASDKNNSIGIMIRSGMKGNVMNMSQIAGALGQQYISGKVPPQTLYGNRASIYFDENDDSIESRGFIKESFTSGMRPAGFIFHNGSSRVGLLDTAMKMVDIGSVNQRCYKSLENIRVDYLGAVVNASSVISSLAYGEGYSPVELVHVTQFSKTPPLYFPINLKHVELEFNEKWKSPPPRHLTDTEIDYIASVVPPVIAAVKSIAEWNHSEIVRVLKLNLSEIKISPSAIEKLRDRVHYRCKRAAINPGDTVGTHASEAIGQPTSQMVLNSFHQSGSAEVGNSPLGLFSEIISLTQRRKVPMAYIYTNTPINSYEEGVDISRAFMSTSLKNFLIKKSIAYEILEIKDDEELPSHYALYELISNTSERPWRNIGERYARVYFSSYKLFEYRILMSDIVSIFEESGGIIVVPSTSKNAYIDIYGKNEICADFKRDCKSSKNVKITDAMRSIVSSESSGGKKKVEKHHPFHVEEKIRVMKEEIEKLKSEASGAASPTVAPPKKKKIVTTATDAEKMAMMSIQNAKLIYLQMFIIPKFQNTSFVVSSSYSSNNLNTEGEYVPRSSRNLSLFKYVRIIRESIFSIVRHTEITRKSIKFYTSTDLCIKHGISQDRFKSYLASILSDLDSFKAIELSGDNDVSDFVEVKFSEAFASEIGFSTTALPTDDDVKRYITTKGVEMGIYDKQLYFEASGAISNSLQRLHSHPAIDTEFTITNTPHEIFEVLGVEAARSWIMRELYELVKSTGSTINPRHLQTVVDIMISSGALMPFNARGSVRQQLGAFSESSFDQALVAFKRSAAKGTVESVMPTSTSTLIGTPAPFGTGSFKVCSNFKFTTASKAAQPHQQQGQGQQQADGGDDDVWPPPASSALFGTMSNRAAIKM